MAVIDDSRLRSSDVLASMKAQNTAALIAYLPVGFPSLTDSIQTAHALIDAGVSMIEWGIPYTDPVMDGPVIQQAANQALAQGTRPRDVFTAIDQCAGRGAAMLVMSYYNPILAYGEDAFARDLAACGGAGIITPDLTPDSGGRWIEASERHALDRIFLVAPSSPRERLERVSRSSKGFVYAASTMGVTGVRSGSVGSIAADLVQRTRQAGAENVCVGLGVSHADQAAEVAGYADGVIVGSAFVRVLLQARTPREGRMQAAALATDMIRAISASR